MSLDVYLTQKDACLPTSTRRIFIRDNGQNREINRAEWDARYPGRELVTVTSEPTTDTVFSANITHNLVEMAQAADIYKPLWRPDENGITKANQLIEPLTAALARLTADKKLLLKHNPPNGWGTYELLLAFVTNYLDACQQWPDSDVTVCR